MEEGRQKFRLDLGKGDLKLGPLELRPEAFLHSENAIEVRAGYVGSLRISFPKLMEITSAPLTIELDSVLVLLGLPMRKQWESERKADEAEARRARHQAAIAAAEQLLQSLQTASGVESIAKAAGLKNTAAFLREDSFMTRQILRLADNLRLHVRDVHVVLDDCSLIPASPFAVGLSIDSITLLPTTESDAPPTPAPLVAPAPGGPAAASRCAAPHSASRAPASAVASAAASTDAACFGGPHLVFFPKVKDDGQVSCGGGVDLHNLCYKLEYQVPEGFRPSTFDGV